MKGLVVILLFFIAFCMSSCDDCTNCEPFTEEPYLTIRFLNKADSSKRVIIIYSVNQDLGRELRHFQDTTYEYKFPMDMHHDTAVYQIVYRDTSDLAPYVRNNITLIYDRQFLRRDDNYIVVECNINGFTTDFGEYELICKDTSNIECISNVAIAKIYN